MSSELVDAAPQRTSSDAATLASLPLPLAHRIFLALPVDARGRACCVCRAWRDVLADPSLWTRLDMSDVDVEWQRFAAMLQGAAGRARGGLSNLDLSQRHVELEMLLPVLTANAGSLRELHLKCLGSSVFSVTPEAVVVAAPLLQVLTVEEVSCKWEEAPRLLRAEPPFAALQMRYSLKVDFRCSERYYGGMERVAPFAAALADVALQPALSHLCVDRADTDQPAVMAALVDAALARRLRQLSLENCSSPVAAPLARLLAEGSLTHLELVWVGLFDDEAGAALMADALRVNTTLTQLNLCEAFLCDDVDGAGILLGALVGHPSMRRLVIIGEETPEGGRSVFGTAVAALIAADAPALRALVCCNSSLGDAGLAPIVDALALNRHLHKLDLSCNDMSTAFARERLLPAVRSNSTLREFMYEDVEPFSSPAAAEAVELVRRRAQQS